MNIRLTAILFTFCPFCQPSCFGDFFFIAYLSSVRQTFLPFFLTLQATLLPVDLLFGLFLN